MRRLGVCAAVLGVCALLAIGPAQEPPRITIDYPEDGTVFPPEITPPSFLWRDSASGAGAWRIEVAFSDGAPPLRFEAKGERLSVGEIDQRCVGPTNELPKLSAQLAAAHTWKPDPAVWTEIKRRSTGHPATLTISGFRTGSTAPAISQGSASLQTSPDPVGAPIFYRDVPLMPSELEKGVIKPLASSAIPLIAWRLRNVGEPRSRVLMEGLHTCANCHSFSLDGKTLGMDLDGPQNDKGMYTLASIQPQMSIRNEDVISWKNFRGKLTGDLRIGFMSQVSPEGRFVVTTIKGPALDDSRSRSAASNYYVANFKDYRFLQVFYPTQGVLAWYSREKGVLQPLPGADDPQYVQTTGVWSPDGKYLVFARAAAKQPYAPGQKLAEFANDPNETRVQFDLYRIPFNEGRGGTPEPIRGASANGMSNTFPKISPDGKWIVFVQCRNGMLMRPDSQLYIVPSGGGQARRLRANTPLMNSWHSFSPNGRWLVFSSKSRSPYTQMYLTHLDEQGNSTPPVLIDNTTAANRAVNIPEFVNVPPDGLMKIATPAVDFYRLYDQAYDLGKQGQYPAAVEAWNRALALDSTDARAYLNLGIALSRTGRSADAMAQYRKAIEISPDNVEAHNNLGIALAGAGDQNGAMAEFREALRLNPEYSESYNNLGLALAASGKADEALANYRKALELKPDYGDAHNNLGLALARAGKLAEAVPHFQKAAQSDPKSVEVHENLALALSGTGQLKEAVAEFQKLVTLKPGAADAYNDLGLALAGAGRPLEAIPQFQRALEIDPNLAEAHLRLGEIQYSTQGRAAEAILHWRAALRLEPDRPEVLASLARALATNPDAAVRNGAEAISLAGRAVQLTGGRDPSLLGTLAAAYAEAGRFQDAVSTVQRALALAASANQQPLAAALKGNLALYEAKSPLRLPAPRPAGR